MQGNQQGWSRHHDELQSPETHLVLTARLLGVAYKILLLILPHLLGCCHIHQDPEEKDHREPNASDHGRVLVHPTENVFQKAPIHLPPRWPNQLLGLGGKHFFTQGYIVLDFVFP
uniref:Uncharacterized protein n=1 Tax=Monopterus albus TaxID=43700 RepID=A0A3Q3JK43_MONAL